MTTLQEAAQAAMKYIRSTADYKAGHPVAIEAAEDLSDALAQQGEPVAYEVDATKFANGKQLTYDKPENLPSYLTYRPLYAGTQAQQIQEPETAMIDAAMVEMANITPPLRRSECKRLIRAALSAAPASQAQKPAAYITDTHQGPMVWTPEMYDEACTYCDDGEFPVPLYTAAPAPQAQDVPEVGFGNMQSAQPVAQPLAKTCDTCAHYQQGKRPGVGIQTHLAAPLTFSHDLPAT